MSWLSKTTKKITGAITKHVLPSVINPFNALLGGGGWLSNVSSDDGQYSYQQASALPSATTASTPAPKQLADQNVASDNEKGASQNIVRTKAKKRMI